MFLKGLCSEADCRQQKNNRHITESVLVLLVIMGILLVIMGILLVIMGILLVLMGILLVFTGYNGNFTVFYWL